MPACNMQRASAVSGYSLVCQARVLTVSLGRIYHDLVAELNYHDGIRETMHVVSCIRRRHVYMCAYSNASSSHRVATSNVHVFMCFRTTIALQTQRPSSICPRSLAF